MTSIASCYPMVHLLLLLLFLRPCLGQSPKWHDYVTISHYGCCQQATHRCKGVDAFTRGQNGKFYLFFKKTYITMTFRPNGYPVVQRKASNKISGGWIGLMDALPAEVAFHWKDKITIKQGNTYFEFRKDRVPVTVDKDCQNHHKLFCIKDTKIGDIQAVAVLEEGTGKRGDKALVYATYCTISGLCQTLRFIGDGPASHGQATLSNQLTVRAMGAYLRDDLNKMTRGFVFSSTETKLGTVHEFRKPWTSGPWSEKEDLAPFFEHTWPVGVFFGCPQSFCHKNDVDDILMMTKSSSMGEDELVIFRGPYVFVRTDEAGAPASKPFKLPSIDKALPFKNKDGNNYGPFPSQPGFIDAAEAFVFNAQKMTLVFKDDQVYVWGTDHKSFVNPHEIEETIRKVSTDMTHLDAVWFNRKHNLLFLFKGQMFWTFKPESKGKKIAWTLEGSEVRYIGLELKGLPSNIDGILSKDGKAYFLRNDWFYEISEDNWVSTPSMPAPIEGKVMFNAFFDMNGCGYTPEDIKDIIAEVRKRPPPEATPPPIVTTTPAPSSSTSSSSTSSSSTSSSSPSPSETTTVETSDRAVLWYFILAIFIFLLLIVILVVIVAYAVIKSRHQKKLKETSRRGPREAMDRWPSFRGRDRDSDSLSESYRDRDRDRDRDRSSRRFSPERDVPLDKHQTEGTELSPPPPREPSPELSTFSPDSTVDVGLGSKVL